MLGCLLLGVVLQGQSTVRLPGAGRPISEKGTLLNPDGPPLTMYIQSGEPLAPAKLSPKKFDGKRWEFDWHVDGYGKPEPTLDQLALRFRVFAQDRLPANDPAKAVARELLRLWEMDFKRLKLDHADQYNSQIVDVYLCEKGEPGGEQLFDVDDEAGYKRKVDTIYIYDLKSFNDKIEQAREVAHEYGHAVLPGIGGYSQPEYWANGYLGEKLFMKWLRDDMATNRLLPVDAMGATLSDLDGWVKTNVDPLVRAAAVRPPDSALYKGKTATSMNAALGLMLYCESMFPPAMFGRSMRLINGSTISDYINAAAMAAEENDFVPKLANLGTPVWIPVGASHVTGGTVMKTADGWALVKPGPNLKIVAKNIESN